MATARQIVTKAVRFEHPERVPRDCWVVPWAERRFPDELATLRQDYPMDLVEATLEYKRLPHMRGDRNARGVYVDEWGCQWMNIQDGATGEVKEPLVATWNELGRLRPPYEWLEGAFDRLDEACTATPCFVLGSIGSLFERMQDIRTTEQLLVDLMEQRKELFKLRDLVHEFNLTVLERLVATGVDGIVLWDDWGAQNALIMPPALWREFFKPCYKEYVDLTHGAGKLFFMHSDGNITEVFEDVIEIGFNALNAQLFCMDIEEIGKRFKGRICFWGEIDRQHVLTTQDVSAVTRAVERVHNALYDPSGGIIAQCEFGLASRPENVREVYAAWDRLSVRT